MLFTASLTKLLNGMLFTASLIKLLNGMLFTASLTKSVSIARPSGKNTLEHGTVGKILIMKFQILIAAISGKRRRVV